MMAQGVFLAFHRTRHKVNLGFRTCHSKRETALWNIQPIMLTCTSILQYRSSLQHHTGALKTPLNLMKRRFIILTTTRFCPCCKLSWQPSCAFHVGLKSPTLDYLCKSLQLRQFSQEQTKILVACVRPQYSVRVSIFFFFSMLFSLQLRISSFVTFNICHHSFSDSKLCWGLQIFILATSWLLHHDVWRLTRK